ncbi:amidohydrolase family protein [Streptomyces sp. NPDC020917]|uniref:amidohydrolase family protein n=1 Tax=Streptomyces sp. NPDC020917 TaxID=3365102 RepID=UPI003795D7F8
MPDQPCQTTDVPPPAALDGITETHVHLWDKALIEYPWLARWPHLGERVDAERLAADLPPLSAAVFIEAAARPDLAAAELDWLAGQAGRCRFPVRIVAQLVPGGGAWWLDQPGADLVGGVRRVMHHAADGALLGEDFTADIKAIRDAGLAVDLTVRHGQLPEVAELCRREPRTVFVLDHLGKPAPHEFGFSRWAADLAVVAANPNIVCKLSSIAVQPGDPAFQPDVAAHHVAFALGAFGAERCLYGTDWPVSTHATSFDQWRGVVRSALEALSPGERDAVMRENALRVYGFNTS